MGVHEYRFIHHWRVESTVEEVTEIMTDAEDLPRWWPAIYISAKILEPGDEQRLGQVVEFHTQGGRLLYTLHWTGRTVETRHPYGYRVETTGDFIGAADLTFEQEGPFVNITLEWTIRVDKPVLRYGSYLVKPVLANNHRWAMRVGQQSLRLELARRHAGSEEERATIPPPPAPFTLRRALPIASAGLAVAGLGLVVLRMNRT